MSNKFMQYRSWLKSSREDTTANENHSWLWSARDQGPWDDVMQAEIASGETNTCEVIIKALGIRQEIQTQIWLKEAKKKGVDSWTAVQAYNFRKTTSVRRKTRWNKF